MDINNISTIPLFNQITMENKMTASATQIRFQRDKAITRIKKYAAQKLQRIRKARDNKIKKLREQASALIHEKQIHKQTNKVSPKCVQPKRSFKSLLLKRRKKLKKTSGISSKL